jgi:membrane fusion protein (multidrug efflux system)
VNQKKNKIIFAIGAVVLILAVYFGWQAYAYVESDDAQVSGHVAMLSSRVGGTIQSVSVEENQKVKAGQVLAQIDTSDYANSADAAKAQVASLQARYTEAQVNYERAVGLLQKQAISRERYDEAQAAYKELGAKLKAAEAQASQANLNVAYTKVIAPTDGTIARKSVENGQFVPAGQPLFGFVETNERWVTANLKETELGNVKVGQKVDVDVDAISGRKFDGVVESISPGTGAVFSLLPPDNATGNFTKVVQRVPVRVKLEHLSEADSDLLQTGLSAVVKIHVR